VRACFVYHLLVYHLSIYESIREIADEEERRSRPVVNGMNLIASEFLIGSCGF
jgi:hypothetical protein